ncbi:tyrosine-type recombinase/integrase [Salinarimonas chemoclinalis]|uniref:tyrosine-type recombinase/integrase n=1 Tax=Salinarimonas chemoclinalis TaxID=3241599 RepID=UPI003557F37D
MATTTTTKRTRTLTDAAVAAAKPKNGERTEIPAGGGLYLVVGKSGAKSWAYRYRMGGKPRKWTLPKSYPEIGLRAARAMANEAAAKVERGIDPAGERAEERAAERADRFRFSTVAGEYLDRVVRPRMRTADVVARYLTAGDVGAAWGARDVRTITRRDVRDLLDGVVSRGAPIMANRLLDRMKPFFAWCVEREIIPASPAAGISKPSAETSRDRVLTDAELRAIYRAAEHVGYPFGRAVQMLILTGQRRSEVLEARWSEFDLDAGTWTIPRERSKTDRAHVVHLSAPALEILRGLPRIAAEGETRAVYLFTTTGASPFSGVTKALARLEEAAGDFMPDGEALAPWRLHDLRRTFASGCARLGVPVHVTEKALNHTGGSMGGIVAVYQRHAFLDERRDALETWGRFVAGLVGDRPAGNVVELRRAGA